jgi:hypothetical protein
MSIDSGDAPPPPPPPPPPPDYSVADQPLIDEGPAALESTARSSMETAAGGGSGTLEGSGAVLPADVPMVDEGQATPDLPAHTDPGIREPGDLPAVTDQGSSSTDQSTQTDMSDQSDSVVEDAKAIELDTKAGSAYYGPDDLDMREAAQEVKPADGYHTIDMHGSESDPDHVYFQNKDSEMESLSADQLAVVIQDNDHWDGQPVRLYSCWTGQDPPSGGDSFGQQLSDSLGVDVQAPTSWVSNDANGDPVLGSGGEWQVFHPRTR